MVAVLMVVVLMVAPLMVVLLMAVVLVVGFCRAVDGHCNVLSLLSRQNDYDCGFARKKQAALLFWLVLVQLQ